VPILIQQPAAERDQRLDLCQQSPKRRRLDADRGRFGGRFGVGLSAEEAAHACALAAARLVKMCAEVLDARIGFALAAQGFVEGSKTMPVALAGDARGP
jgi:hypothetical protein